MVINTISKVAHNVAQTWKKWEKFAPKVLLAFVGFALVVLALQLFTTSLIDSHAVGGSTCEGSLCWTWSGTNKEGSVASTTVEFKNNTADNITLQIARELDQCKDVNFTGKSDPDPILTCYGGSTTWEDPFTLAPNQTRSFTATQEIANNGQCGSAQVDIFYKVNNGPKSGPFWGVAHKQPCQETNPKVQCDNLTLEKAAGEFVVKATVTGSAKDGGKITKYQFKFDNGGFEDSNDNVKKHNYTAAGTYTVTGRVVDQDGKAHTSGACQKSITFEGQKHYACESDACVLKDGPGDTQAQCNAKCGQTHLECKDYACAKVAGGGANTGGCTIEGQSCNQKHFVCENYACVQKNGAGDNTGGCNAGNVGTSCNQKHFVCENYSCVQKNGPGNNTGGCYSGNVGSTCQQTQYAVCDNLAVSPNSGNDPVMVTANLDGHTVNGGSILSYRYLWGDGSETTTTNSNDVTHEFTSPGTYTIYGFVKDNVGNEIGGAGACRRQITVKCTDCEEKTHAECIDNQCQIRSGDGPQSCSSDCGQAHHVCRNESCQYVAGALRDGDVLCTSDSNCRVKKEQHLECRNQACTVVDGAGANTCTTDANCKAQPTHTTCQNEACITLAGAGTSQCVMNSDCVRTVVYENIPNTGPEMPILGGLFGSGVLGWFVRRLKFIKS